MTLAEQEYERLRGTGEASGFLYGPIRRGVNQYATDYLFGDQSFIRVNLRRNTIAFGVAVITGNQHAIRYI